MIEDNTSSTHPPLPPTTEDERIARLRLLRSRRVGPATYRRLLGEHGSARAALDALPNIARTSGVSDYKICPMGVVHAELNAAHSSKARLVFEGDPDFPNDLAQIDDAPVMLWMTGTPSVLHRPLIALVGARNPSSLGTRMARKLAQDLGEAGFTVVSGLARGVDAAAHGGALATGTIAVVAGGRRCFVSGGKRRSCQKDWHRRTSHIRPALGVAATSPPFRRPQPHHIWHVQSDDCH